MASAWILSQRAPSTQMAVPPLSRDLIFDIGMHRGEDSEFYLRKGFRVVAVEAIDSFCRTVAERLVESVPADAS